MIYTASEVMDDAAVLLNDAAQTLYNYTVQLPFIKMVMRDLEQELQLAGSSLDIIDETAIAVGIGDTALALPANFFMPLSLQEKGAADTTYSPMFEKRSLVDLRLTAGKTLQYWDFSHNSVQFIGATEARTVKMTYYRLLTEIVDEDSLPDVIGARNLLAYRTAAMCAQYIGRDLDRATLLNSDAAASLERLTALTVKNNQGLRTRRRPFRIKYGRTIYVRLP